MKAVFGVIALLIVVAVVGFVAGHQLKTLRQMAPTATGAATAGSAAAAGGALPPVQQQVRDDLAKALEQGAQNNARSEEAAK